MNIAFSNIAWPVDQDAAVADTLAALGVAGLEIAPTKVWPSPLEATDAQIDSYRQFWVARGMPIIAAQALLFGRSDLTLFEDAEIRKRTLEYLRGIMRVCARAGAKVLVFGSPRNRRAGDRDRATVWQEAVDFFGQLGRHAAVDGMVLAMEANPPAYGADFVTRAAEALQLVREVNHPGFRLHLDTACMHLAGDDPDSLISTAMPFLAHFHASEPHLASVELGTINHAQYGQLLAAHGYHGWISIEMRQAEPFDLAGLRRALLRVHTDYCGST